MDMRKLQYIVKKVAVMAATAVVFIGTMPMTDVAFGRESGLTRVQALEQIEKFIGADESGSLEGVSDVSMYNYYGGITNASSVVATAIGEGLIKPDKNGKIKPDAKATYGYVAAALSKYEQNPLKKVIGKNKSGKKITKSELNKFLNKRFPNVIKKDTAKLKKGNVLILKPVSLRNVSVKGNLIIADSAGAVKHSEDYDPNEILLDSIKVSGKIIVRGCSQARLSGTSSDSIVTEGTASQYSYDKGSAGVIIDRYSKIKTVTVDAPYSRIVGTGEADTVKVNADSATVLIKAAIKVKSGISAPKTKPDKTSTIEYRDSASKPTMIRINKKNNKVVLYYSNAFADGATVDPGCFAIKQNGKTASNVVKADVYSYQMSGYYTETCIGAIVLTLDNALTFPDEYTGYAVEYTPSSASPLKSKGGETMPAFSGSGSSRVEDLDRYRIFDSKRSARKGITPSAYRSENGNYLAVRLTYEPELSGKKYNSIRVKTDKGLELKDFYISQKYNDDISYYVLQFDNLPSSLKISSVTVSSSDGRTILDECADPVTGLSNIKVKTAKKYSIGKDAYYCSTREDGETKNTFIIPVNGEILFPIESSDFYGNFDFDIDGKMGNIINDPYPAKGKDGKWYLVFNDSDGLVKGKKTFKMQYVLGSMTYYRERLQDASGAPIKFFNGYRNFKVRTVNTLPVK